MKTIYRDRKTGKFVKRSTWKRSRAQGGIRYRRQRIGPVQREGKPAKVEPDIRRPLVTTTALSEWFVSLSYSGPRARTLDFFVLAKNRQRVLPLIFERIFDKGQDDLGYDLSWAQKINWQESDIDEIDSKNSRITLAPMFRVREWVEVH